MGKGKGRKIGGGGPHKNHGPKRHMFNWAGTSKQEFGAAGLLNKYNNFESWQLACTAKGKKSSTMDEFKEFVCLSMEAKRAFFKNIKAK